MSSATVAKTNVDAYLREMASKNMVSPWKNIKKEDLGRGLKARVDDPSLISSKVVNLCGPAAFFHNLAIDDPEMYAQVGIDLYGPNIAKLGKRKFWAGRDLMNATPPSDMDAADWVVLAALRDHENVVLDYDDADGGLSGLSMPSALERWFEEAGYGSIRDETNLFFTKSRGNIKKAGELVANGNRVCLFINSDMLKPSTQMQKSTFPDHWVVLKKSPHGSAVSIRHGLISFRVHSWGKVLLVPSTGVLKVDDFTKNYYGYVAAKPK